MMLPDRVMMEGTRFSRESLTYVAGEFLSRSLTFLLLPVYTSYLSIDDFAVLVKVTMIWPIVVILIGKGFSSYLMRGYYEADEKREFLGTILLFSMIGGCLLALGIHGAGPTLLGWFFKKTPYRPFLQYGVLFAVFRLFFNHVVSIYRAKRMAFTSVGLSVFLFFAHAAAAIYAIVFLKTDLRGLLNAQVTAYGVVSIVYIIRIIPDIRLRFEKRFIPDSLAFVLPLVPHALSGWVINYVSRIFIEQKQSQVTFSVFSVAAQIAMILAVINNGLNQAWIPFIYSNASRDDFRSVFTRHVRHLLLFVSLIGGGILLFAKDLLELMGKAEYLEARHVLPILVGAYIFQLLYFCYVALILYRKQTGLMPLITLSTGVVCILLNGILVPVWGQYGAALATTVSFGLMTALVIRISRKDIHVRILNPRIVLYFAGLVLILLLSFHFVDPLDLVLRLPLKVLAVLGWILLLRWLDLFRPEVFIQSLLKKTWS